MEAVMTSLKVLDVLDLY